MPYLLRACLAASLALALPGLGLAQETAKPATRKAEPKPRPEGKKAEGKKAEAPKGEKKASPKEAAKPASVPGGSSATLVATFADWSAYTAQSGKAKICYALSQPKARAPASLKDIPAYVFVSFRPADNIRNEVAAVLNFKTKDGGTGSLAVGSTSYDIVTKGENAWVKNQADEVTAVGTMAKGGTMTLTATSAKGNKTTDRYSLSGFDKALDRAKRDCP